MSLLTLQSQSRGSSKCCPEIERQRTRYRSRRSADDTQFYTVKNTTTKHDHVYNNTSTDVRKSWRSGTSTTLPGCHTGGSG